ncbi:MAG TPA: hypothetical protein VFL16_18900, partial [Steroidobacteraceae bacterium]|nr:hypothetical protein [Steroidobacteraceae bacterium]
MSNRLVVTVSAAVLTAVGLAACAGSTSKPAKPPGPAAAPVPAPAPVLRSGLDLTVFDRSVRPQDDLYRFVG